MNVLVKSVDQDFYCKMVHVLRNVMLDSSLDKIVNALNVIQLVVLVKIKLLNV
jgi:hypothetical protein